MPEEDIHVSHSEKTVTNWLSELTSNNITSNWLTAIIESADDAIISKTLDGIITSWNNGAERIFGYTAAEAIGRHISLLIPDDLQDEEVVIIGRIRSGQRIDHYETTRKTKHGELLNVSLTVSPIKGPDGNVVGASKIARDVTESRRAAAALKEQKEIIETIQGLGQLLSAELELEKLVQAVTDAATELTGAQFGAFFYNVISEKGSSYMLYSLSGVPREAFSNFPMPRATELFGPTFRGEGTIRIDEVKKDPRYGKSGPYHGMPPGHLPVNSYLAVPVISRSGEVIGGSFSGTLKKRFLLSATKRSSRGSPLRRPSQWTTRVFLKARRQPSASAMRCCRGNRKRASRPRRPAAPRTIFSVCFRMNCARRSTLSWVGQGC